jgi:Tol biopolymer transport system component/DNA-binding winged helix-turn-helix (wHTH) protein
MNEHVALWPKLALARELPFMLAGTQVRPSALEVETDGRVTTLEPRVMKVLVALHRARGHPVSRDEMIDLCWEGRIVTEGALNRCVAQLRKALADNPRVNLDTIPTVGYRLQASGEVRRLSPEPAAVVGAPVAPKPSHRRWIAAGGAAAVAAAVAVAAWLALTPRPVAWITQAYHPLTAELGMETHPAISPNGQQLVYAQRPDSTVGRDLYIRGVDQGTPVRVTADPADDHSAAWSPSGDRVVFVRSYPDGACALVVVPVPIGPERVAARCESSTYTRVGWLDGDTLAISDKPKPSLLYRIRSVDLTSGAVRDLTAPPVETLGDFDPSVSPNGRYIAFRRSLLHGADDLYLKDLKTGRERALTTDGWKAAGYVWSADSRHIFYSSNRGGEFGLWTIDTARREPPKRIGLGVGQLTFSRMSIDRRNRLAVEAPRTRNNIAAVSPDGTIRPITNAIGGDWDPQGAPDGTVAYASGRSGGSDLWVTRPDGQSVRLTSMGGSYVHSPHWSPDGQSLVFVGVKGRRSELYTIARDGSRLRAITSDGQDKLDPVWGPDGRIRYLERIGPRYRVMQLDLTSGIGPTPTDREGFWALRMTPDGRLFGQAVNAETAGPLHGGGPHVPVGYHDTWTVGRDGIYVKRSRRPDAPAAVWLHPWNGPARRIADVPTMSGEIGAGANGQVLISRGLDEQVDLGLFDLSAGR